MKITKHILAACILTGMAACDTDKEIAVFNEDSGAIKINAVIDADTLDVLRVLVKNKIIN